MSTISMPKKEKASAESSSPPPAASSGADGAGTLQVAGRPADQGRLCQPERCREGRERNQEGASDRSGFHLRRRGKPANRVGLTSRSKSASLFDQRIVLAVIQGSDAESVQSCVAGFQNRSVQKFRRYLLDGILNGFGSGIEPAIADRTVARSAACRKQISGCVVVEAFHVQSYRPGAAPTRLLAGFGRKRKLRRPGAPRVRAIPGTLRVQPVIPFELFAVCSDAVLRDDRLRRSDLNGALFRDQR